MEVWAAYGFLHQTDEQQLEKDFARLPAHVTGPVYRYRDPADRTGRMISRILLETLIKKYFPYQGFSWDHYCKDALSKPYLEGQEINFSTAHHENFSIVCITREAYCGIDSELIKPLQIDVYNDFLHPEEKQFIDRQINPQTAFYEIWTKKEAVLKASGLGIYQGLQSIDAHKDIIEVNNKEYFSKRLNISENSMTHMVAEKEITQLNIEEIIF